MRCPVLTQADIGKALPAATRNRLRCAPWGSGKATADGSSQMADGFLRWCLVSVTLLLVEPAALAQVRHKWPQPPVPEPTTTQAVPTARAARSGIDCGQS